MIEVLLFYNKNVRGDMGLSNNLVFFFHVEKICMGKS